MDLSASILGRSIVTYIVESQRSAVLRIGRDVFTRSMLASVACYHFVAAANLSKVLNAEIQVKDTRDVFDNVSPDRLVLPRLGAVSLAVLGAAFEAKKLGGSAPLENWFKHHRDSTVTFASLKHHAAVTRAATVSRRRRRAAR